MLTTRAELQNPGLRGPLPLVVFLLPCTAAFGSLIPGLGPIFGFRVLVVVLVVATMLGLRRRITDTRAGSAVIILIAAWCGATLIGLLVGDHSSTTTRTVGELAIGLALVFCLAATGDPWAVLRALRHGWTFAFLVTGAVAIREVVTGRHLSNYFPSTDLVNVDPRLIASSFGNPNNYAAFLVTTLPFLAVSLLTAERWSARWAYGAMMILLFGLMLGTGSRLCIVALVVEGVLLMGLRLGPGGRTLRRVALAGMCAVVVLGLALFATAGSSALTGAISILPGKLGTLTPQQIVQESTGSGAATSGERRVNLYLDGLWMIGRSGGLGMGPGNFETTMDSGSVPYYAGGVLSPHNLYLEIASQYGLLVFAAFLLAVIIGLRAFWRAARMPGGDGEDGRPRPTDASCWGSAFLVVIAGNSISAMASSSYLTDSTSWVFMGATALVAIQLERGEPSGKIVGRTTPAATASSAVRRRAVSNRLVGRPAMSGQGAGGRGRA